MSIPVRHQMYKDLGILLNNEMKLAGFKTNPNYPNKIESQPGASTPEKHDYYHSWNMAYQFYSVLFRDISGEIRPVVWSKQLAEKRAQGLISPVQLDAIGEITKASNSGSSLRHFMSTNISNASFEDKMYSDWKIAHLHLNLRLSSKPKHQTKLTHFVERSGPILFAFPYQSGLYLIDIRAHGDNNPDVWVERNLFEIIHENWPHIIEDHRMENMRNTKDAPTPTSQIKILRDKNVNSFITMGDGTTYRPLGGGLSSAGSNINITIHTDGLFHKINSYLEEIKQRIDELVINIDQVSGVKLTELDIELTLDQRNQPVFVEKSHHIALKRADQIALPLRPPRAA